MEWNHYLQYLCYLLRPTWLRVHNILYCCARFCIRKLEMNLRENNSHVLVIFTGGTIGMVKNDKEALVPIPKHFPQTLRKHPLLNDQEYAAKFTENENSPFALPRSSAKVRQILYWIIEYDPLLDSSNMTMKEWMQIANDIKTNYERFDGFVILHGTDTLSYTSASLSFMLENLGKTVVITGSQVPVFQSRSDGIDNFISSLIIAGNYVIPEVCVCFGNKLLRGNRTVKISTESFHAFDSPNATPIATFGITIEVHQEEIFRPTTIEKFIVHSNLNPNVGLLRLFPNITTATVEAFLKPPMEGVVLQTYGSGNISSTRKDILKLLADANLRGVIIINCTQCLRGGVSAVYETHHVLAEIGVIPGFDMTPETALTKLSYVLSKTEWDLVTKKAMMEKNLRGELTNRNLKDTNPIHLLKNIFGKQMSDDEMKYMKDVFLPSALCEAAAKGDLEKIKFWESVGGNLTAANVDLRTPLHVASCEGHLSVVEHALSSGASVHAKDRFDRTPLDDAIAFNHRDIIAMLIKCGAHLRWSLSSKYTELMCLAASLGNQNNLESFRLAGADFNVQDATGRTPLHYAIAANQINVARYLLDKGASPSVKDKMNQSPYDVGVAMGVSDIFNLVNPLDF